MISAPTKMFVNLIFLLTKWWVGGGDMRETTPLTVEDGGDEANNGENDGGDVRETTPLTVSASFKEGKKLTAVMRPSLNADEFFNLLHGSDPTKLQLNRFENEVKGQPC
ncbi:hypothetical protein HAX54_013487 [Datura stramonium]|uniref:Uncharacterized protein n=1 Tax=Datura stramonium TaxID=4076 RepID=A0ABS8Y1R0_DATST|nr:hypothetical protein [Datura stramonium]